MKREELLKTKEYWLVSIQNKLFNAVAEYLKRSGTTKSQLAEKMGVSKSYVSQVLNGDFDHRISKLVEICLAVDRVPLVNFKELGDFIHEDYIVNQVEIKTEFKPIMNQSISSPEPYLDKSMMVYGIDFPTELSTRYIAVASVEATVLN